MAAKVAAVVSALDRLFNIADLLPAITARLLRLDLGLLYALTIQQEAPVRSISLPKTVAPHTAAAQVTLALREDIEEHRISRIRPGIEKRYFIVQIVASL